MAKLLYTGIEDNVLMVGWADDPYEPAESVLLTYSLEMDEQDVELGMDQVYIEYADQSRGAYGGVERVTLRDGSASLVLSPDTALRLKTETQIEIEFPQNAENLQTAREYLTQMFTHGHGQFVFAGSTDEK